MEKLLNPYDKESMKMAMLKHEETFRYQVYELHRLYQIQKGLMKNIADEKRQENHNGSKKAAATNSNEKQDSSKGSGEDCIGESGDVGRIEDESELELTLGPSCYNNRMRKAAETSFSSSSSDSNPVFLSEIKSGSNNASSAEQFRQDKIKNNPRWLFQFLSLNMTLDDHNMLD